MIENNLKYDGFEPFYFVWSFKTEESEGSVAAVQCFRKTNSEIKNFSEYWKKNLDKTDATLCKNKSKCYWIFTVEDKERNKIAH